MPKLNVQQNNQNVIQAFKNALAIGNLKGIIASDGSHNFSTAGSNRNLLDNPWFTVNQRGFTSNTNANNVPAVDRWKINNGSGTQSITSDGFKIDLSATTSYCSFQQAFGNDELAGKTVTISVCSNGTIYSTTATVPARTTATQTAMSYTYTSGQLVRLFVMPASSAYGYLLQFSMTGVVATIRAVKLELGSVSTLANDAPPDYDEELRKCQYYYREIELGAHSSLGMAWAYSATGASMTNIFGFANAMRTTPTISITGDAVLQTQTGTTITVTAIRLSTDVATGITNINFVVASGLTANQPVRVNSNSSGLKIAFNADL